MSSYIGTVDRPDRAKAIAAVIAVHVGLAAIILAGLNVRMVTAAVEQLKTFDIREPPPPAPPKPPPQRPALKPQQARQAAGEPARKAEAAQIVAPAPRLPVPIPAAKVAGTGSAPSSGAGTAGTGTGAGGSGTGPGGGGYGDFSRFTPARIVRKIPNSEYRRISAGRLPIGSATIGFRVTPDGRMAGCRVVRSSGDPYVDSIVCDAAMRNMRFSPARDPTGRPVAQDMAYTPTWSPKRY